MTPELNAFPVFRLASRYHLVPFLKLKDRIRDKITGFLGGRVGRLLDAFKVHSSAPHFILKQCLFAQAEWRLLILLRVQRAELGE